MKAPHLVLLISLLLPLSSCSSVRRSTPLLYAGDGRVTVASLESSIQKRGYKPVCKSHEFCKFAYGEQVWVHFKASEKKVVLAVDVTDGTKLPRARVQALTDEATRVAEAIWAEASSDARAREQVIAEQKAAENAAENAAAAMAKAHKAESTPSGSSAPSALSDLMNAVSRPSGNPATGVSGGVSAPASSSATCCINHAFYDCPSVAAVKKCSGDTSACLMGCMNSSDSSCGDRCMRDHPPDPSGCRRQGDRDGECR
ncbi:MAG: hypothetical protein ACMG6S_02835 [Byssovorax sp.]